MESVAGIFESRENAESAVQQLSSLGVRNDRIAVLTPGVDQESIEQIVPTSDTEQPGMGKAMGGAVGGAMGVAGGASLGAAAASLLVPGVGPVIAGGILGAAILGAGGTVTGMAAGEALEEGLISELPHDELYLYEDALRKGRTVIIAFVDDDEEAEKVRKAFASAGAESIDAARESWWLELRDAEAAEYDTPGRSFQKVEPSYRRGFEAAQNPKARGRAYEAAASAERKDVSTDAADEAYREGYRRGQAYQQRLREQYPV